MEYTNVSTYIFQVEHKKTYKSEIEEKFRMKIFMENKHHIAKHNAKYEQGLISFKLGMNKYADMVRKKLIFESFCTIGSDQCST